jgi:hypothetical protein
MKKTAYSAILILALLFLVEAQVAMVLANPYWPFPDWGYPKITLTSPVQNGTYTENNVWLNLSVTKPSNWTDYEGQLKYVAYLIDGDRNNLTYSSYNHHVGETRVAVDDPLGVVNPPLEFNLSIKLEGLSEGNHHIDVTAEGLVKYKDSYVSVGSGTIDTINFTVTKESSFPKTLLIASVITIAVVGIGLPIYFKKRKHN